MTKPRDDEKLETSAGGDPERPVITLQYEILTVSRWNTETVTAPDNWAQMSDAERAEWCEEAAMDAASNYIGIGFSYEGMPD